MTAMNIVHMRPKAGQEQAFLDAHKSHDRSEYAGMQSMSLVKTGDRDYTIVGLWDSMDALVAARPVMIATLDEFRDMLEDLGDGNGVTDPHSGEVVLTV